VTGPSHDSFMIKVATGNHSNFTHSCKRIYQSCAEYVYNIVWGITVCEGTDWTVQSNGGWTWWWNAGCEEIFWKQEQLTAFHRAACVMELGGLASHSKNLMIWSQSLSVYTWTAFLTVTTLFLIRQWNPSLIMWISCMWLKHIETHVFKWKILIQFYGVLVVVYHI